MRREMREWVESLLLDRTTLQRGYFQPRTVETLTAQHMRTGRYPKEILSLISLEMWHRVFIDQSIDVHNGRHGLALRDVTETEKLSPLAH